MPGKREKWKDAAAYLDNITLCFLSSAVCKGFTITIQYLHVSKICIANTNDDDRHWQMPVGGVVLLALLGYTIVYVVVV